MLVCINGHFIAHEQARVAITDGAFLYGDSLFETLKAHHQTILLQPQHLDRLEHSAALLAMPCPRRKIETALRQLAVALKSPASRIRLTLSRGSFSGLTFPAPEQSWFLITAVPYAETDDTTRHQGISCRIAPNRRVNPRSHLPQLKHGNYADCLYARQFAAKTGADEALFVDENNNLLEGATSNLFALIDKRLVTPPINNLILDGIMRRQVIAAAAELGILCIERPLPLAEVLDADEVFITNSLINILPVRSVDDHPAKSGQIWKELLKTLSIRIEA